MKWLVLIHVLSAIIGVGPTFYGHVLMRRGQTLDELRHSTKLSNRLDFFPKIGGTIAVISGFVLYFAGDYGKFTQVWLLGSLILYIVIQAVVVGMLMPVSKRLSTWIHDPANQKAKELPAEQMLLYMKANGLLYIASTLGTILFVLMIMKP